jgi:hypothetical protein
MARSWLALALGLPLAVASCTSAPPTITPSSAGDAAGDAAGETGGVAPTVDPSAERLTVTLQNAHVAMGLERLAFQVADATGGPIASSSKVEVSVSRAEEVGEGGTLLQATASGEAVRFGDELTGGGAWVVYHEFDSSGLWSMEAKATLPDGRFGSGIAKFTVEGTGLTPRVGDRPAGIETPKVGGDVPVTRISTDPSPVEALYRLSVSEALSNGKPTVVTFGSPGTCAPCATTIEEVKAVLASQGSRVNFVHVEAVDPADPTTATAAAQAWGIPADVPWTFVFDAQGYVQGRVEGSVSRTELELLVKRSLGD